MFEEKRKQSINAVVFVCCFAVTFDDIEMTQIYDVQKPLSEPFIHISMSDFQKME